MSDQYSADEVFEMAQQIERAGARFYRRGAEILADPEVGKLLRRLAAMEDAHERVFAALRADLTEEERTAASLDPADERALEVRAMAHVYISHGHQAAIERLTGSETVQAILEMAIGLEKDAIVFYLGILPLVPRRLGRGRVDDIISAEMSHLALLSDRLAALQQ